jgi:hypothetical protein
MRKLLHFGVLSLLLLLIGSPLLAQTAPPVGSWSTIPNTRLADALDKRLYGPYNPRDVFANSGGDIAKWNGVWGFFLSGGGHAATPDNSLFFLPLDGSGPKRLLGPYYRPDGNYKQDTPKETYLPFGVWTDAPRSRHTYSCIIYMERQGKPAVFMYAGGAYTGPGGGVGDARFVDLALSFDEQMARADMGWQRTAQAPWPVASGQCGWDPVQKRVVIRSAKGVGAYYPDQDRWEDWRINSDATYCCDFIAMVAMDVQGRWMYVLGDSVVERYNLDTKAYESLRSRSWALPFASRTWQVPPAYPSFGLGWHERTKQLVVVVSWVNPGGPGGGDSAKDILLIDPASNVVTKATMTGDIPPDPGIFGSYGRVRIISGTDQIASVVSTLQNAYIGTIPFGRR